MSTEIMYRKAFIKVDSTRTVPVIEQGSSNCTMYRNGREVTARSWGNEYYFSKGQLIVDNENWLKAIELYRENCDCTDEDFCYHVGTKLYGKSGRSFKDFKGFYSGGIKSAKTIEDYAKYGVLFSIRPYGGYNAEFGTLVEKPTTVFDSTAHMIETIKEYTEYYKGSKIHCMITLCNEYAFERMVKRERLEKKTYRYNNSKPKPVLNEFYTIAVKDNRGYFMRYTKHGFKYSPFTITKKFATEKQALKFHTKMRSSDNFEVKFISNL